MRFSSLCGLAAVVVFIGCGDTTETNNSAETNNTACTGGKCDSSDGWIAENLGDRTDPIALFLKEQDELDETDGVFHSTYQEMQFGVARAQECDESTAHNYIISDPLITESEAFPRLVGTVCSSQEDKNWQFFSSPPEPNEDTTDLDVHTVEMFAWDASERRYRFYRTDIVDSRSGAIEVDTNPQACAGCHLGHRGLDVAEMPMLPIMNELTQPWEHWNAQPGFDSQEFSVPDDVENAPQYSNLANPTWKASARDLELIIRKGHEQVASARVGRRREPAPASVTVTMSLLRPLFCDEQVNYVSEAGTSGQLLLDSIVDVSLRDLIKKKVPSGWGQKWMDPEARLRMPAPAAGDNFVNMLPVRGSAMTTYESQLASAARGIDLDLAIQIRLLDWQRPVFSDTRCGLWVAANEQFQREQLDVDVNSLRNYELLPILVDEVLRVGETSLLTGEEGRYYLLAEGENLQTLVAAIEGGNVAEATCDGGECTCEAGACIADLETAVDVVEAHVQSVSADPELRNAMWETRQERTCIATACYENQPFIPDVEGCSSVCPLGKPLDK